MIVWSSNAHEMISSFNGKPQATAAQIRRRLRLAVKRTAAEWGSYFVSVATEGHEDADRKMGGQKNELRKK
jgi:hypothetical protein